MIVILAANCFAVYLNGENRDSSTEKQVPALSQKPISIIGSNDKRVMIPEAVWKLAGIPKPYINDKFQDLYNVSVYKDG